MSQGCHGPTSQTGGGHRLWAPQQPRDSERLGFFPQIERCGREEGVCLVGELAKVTLPLRDVLNQTSTPLPLSPVFTRFSGIFFVPLQVKAIWPLGLSRP